MTRLILFAALAALTLSAQNAKPDPKAVAPVVTPAPAERALSGEEIAKTRHANKSVMYLREKYNISQYEKEMAEASQEYSAVVVAACISVGVPQEKIQSECGFQNSFGADDKPLLDPAGKPVAARVWWQKPAPPAPQPK